MSIKYGKWYVTNLQVFRTKVASGKRTTERLPKHLYPTDNVSLKKHVAILNSTSVEVFPLRAMVHQFRLKLEAELSSPADQRNRLSSFNRHVLAFYSTSHPTTWKHRQADYGRWLLELGLSAYSIKRAVTLANKYLVMWSELHGKQADILAPVADSRYKLLQGHSEPLGQYIPEADYKLIISASGLIAPHVWLSYHYGLRRAETLSRQRDNVRSGYLFVDTARQSIDKIVQTKSRKTRMVPHWFSSPTECFYHVQEARAMHPDTLWHLWQELMDKLGMSYGMHDLRRTFITNALAKQNARDVMLASGHANINTTMKYLVDPRQLDHAVWLPEATASCQS